MATIPDAKKKPDILAKLMLSLGEFGPYQQGQYVLHAFATIVAGVQMYSLLTVAAIPEHRCEIADVDTNGIMSDLNHTDLARYIPLKSADEIDSCSIYDLTTNTSIKCTKWVYNKTFYSSSRAIEWNFVCDRRWMGAISQTTFMLGILCGNLILGNLADRVGRKPVFCWTALFSLLLGVGVAFTTHFYLFLIMRFFLGMTSCAGSNMAGFVLSMELHGAKKRSTVGVSFQIYFACAIMLVAFWGFIIKDRQLLQIVYGLHALPMMLHWWLMDESPKWLWAKGRYQQSLEIIQKALKFNGSSKKIDIDAIIQDKMKENVEKEEPTLGALEILKRPNMRIRILKLCACWFGNSLIYYGLSFGVRTMKGNPFLIIFLMGLFEIPGYVASIILVNKLGRRFLVTFNMIVSGLCCIIPALIKFDTFSSNIIVYLGKFSIASSYCVIYIYAAELFPTMTRNSAIGLASMSSRISGSLTPLIFLLDTFDPRIPRTVFGVITIFAAFLTCLLPETLGTNMPATLEDGEKFGIGDTCFTHCFGKKQIIDDEKSNHVIKEQLEPLNVED